MPQIFQSTVNNSSKCNKGVRENMKALEHLLEQTVYAENRPEAKQLTLPH